MMSDPLTQKRVAGFSSLMDLLALPVSRNGLLDWKTACKPCHSALHSAGLNAAGAEAGPTQPTCPTAQPLSDLPLLLQFSALVPLPQGEAGARAWGNSH